jgi:4-amino-4-deoxy-L-arabinose transferase-like glycosyltransferase
MPGARVTESATGGDWLDRLIEHPRHVLWLFCLAQIGVWTLATGLIHFAPTRDMAESYLWGHEWVIGTYKHPNMPGWLLEAGRVVTGVVGWPGYFTSELFVAATYLLVYALGHAMMGPRKALAGVLLLAGLFYTAWPSTLMNHDVVQMPFWVAIVLILWHLRRSPSLLVWLALGAVAALGLYAKLSFGVVIASCGLWLLYDPLLRPQLRTLSPWLGLGLFAVLCLPLAGWLENSQFAALSYARERGTTIGASPLELLGGQVLTALGVVLLAYFAGIAGRAAGSADQESAEGQRREPVVPFLVHMLLIPNLMTAALAWLFDSGTRGMWGTPMLSLTGLLVVALAPRRLDQPVLRRLTAIVAGLLVVVPLIYVGDTLIEPRFTGVAKRQGWPQAEMSRRFQAIWKRETGRPLQIVAGDFWIAGLVALKPGDMPSILTNGDLLLSPWITPERLKQQGALLVWELHDPAAPPPFDFVTMIGSRPIHIERFDWPLFTGAPQLMIGYAILAPA